MARFLAVLAILAAGVAGPSLAARAHAVLEETEPADGATLAEAPGEVVLVFSEPVTSPVGGIRAFDSEGDRVDSGEATRGGRPNELRLGLEEGLGSGTYIVTWRAVSADGHPIKGAFVFQVEGGGPADQSLVASLLEGGSGLPWATGNAIFRWVGYAATLLVAGGMAFLAFVDRHPPTPAVRRLLAGAALAGIGAALGTILFQGAEVTGLGWAALVDPAVLVQTLEGPVGISALVRAGALSAFLIVLWAGLVTPPWPGLAAGVTALASFLLTGHTLTSEPRGVMVTADAVHLLAAAAWFGGLVLLAVALRRRRRDDDPVGAGRLVGRFSRLASVSVAGLTLAGLVLAWVEVRAPRAVATPYGWTLVAKTALAAAVIAVGVYNNRRLVPAIAAAPASGPGTPRAGSLSGTAPETVGAADAWSRLRRTVRWEVIGLVMVSLVTAVLVNLQPAAEAAGVTGVFSVYQPVGENQQINLVVDPNRAGTNQIHLYLLSGIGRPIDPPSEVTLELAKPDEGIGPLTRTPRPAGPGHWIHTGPELAIPGEWIVTIRLHASESEASEVEIPVHVNP